MVQYLWLLAQTEGVLNYLLLFLYWFLNYPKLFRFASFVVTLLSVDGCFSCCLIQHNLGILKCSGCFSANLLFTPTSLMIRKVHVKVPLTGVVSALISDSSVKQYNFYA